MGHCGQLPHPVWVHAIAVSQIAKAEIAQCQQGDLIERMRWRHEYGLPHALARKHVFPGPQAGKLFIIRKPGEFRLFADRQQVSIAGRALMRVPMLRYRPAARIPIAYHVPEILQRKLDAEFPVGAIRNNSDQEGNIQFASKVFENRKLRPCHARGNIIETQNIFRRHSIVAD